MASVPERAGTLDPQRFLSRAKAEAVRTLAATAEPLEGHSTKNLLKRPCDLVPEGQEADFRKRMLDSGMCTAIEDHLLARFPDGTPVLYGRLGVYQSPEHSDSYLTVEFPAKARHV